MRVITDTKGKKGLGSTTKSLGLINARRTFAHTHTQNNG